MRNRIIMATVDEMNLRGVKFTMNDLAKRLSISKTSIYEHFSSKQELIHHIVTIAIQDIEEQETTICKNEELSVLDKISMLFRLSPRIFGPINNYRLFEELQHFFPEEYQMVDQFQARQLERILSLVTAGVEAGHVRSVNLHVLRQVITGAMSDLFSYRFLSESNLTFEDALANMADIIVNGLCVKEK